MRLESPSPQARRYDNVPQLDPTVGNAVPCLRDLEVLLTLTLTAPRTVSSRKHYSSVSARLVVTDHAAWQHHLRRCGDLRWQPRHAHRTLSAPRRPRLPRSDNPNKDGWRLFSYAA